MAKTTGRGAWGSRVAFILAAAGSAVGLGNIWRFPTTVGANGGAAFVFVYLLCVLLLGLPVMLAELAIGRRTQKNPVGAFARLAPGTRWSLVGGLGVLTGVAILSYYAVIAGWTLGYVYKTATGELANLTSSQAVNALFAEITANPVIELVLLGLFMALTMAVVVGGVQAGIERWTKVLMPALFLILLLLVIRSVTLPGAVHGLEFYLKPDFSKITPPVLLAALGQAFFSLSLGMGAMITYGSYLSKDDDLGSSATWVAVADTGIALLAGFVIFPAVFSIQGVEPSAGPGLTFLVLPTIFAQLPGGTIFGLGFFMLLSIAALTSTISLLEVVVAYFIDEKGWTRARAVAVFGGLAFLVGVPSALANGAVGSLSSLPLLGKSFLDVMDLVFGNLSLTIGALLLCVFVGWVWGIKPAAEEARLSPGVTRVWGFLIRYVTPLAILAVLVNVVLGG